MIQVIVISESDSSVEMLKTVQRILGVRAVREIHPVVVKSHFTKSKVCGLIRKKIGLSAQTKGTLILTEIYGSTQSNLCLDMLEEKGVCLISGYNLPMLIKAAMLNQSVSLKKLAGEVESAGRKTIKIFQHGK